MTPRMFSALRTRRKIEQDWQAILAGQVAMLIASFGGAKNLRFEQFVLTREPEKVWMPGEEFWNNG